MEWSAISAAISATVLLVGAGSIPAAWRARREAAVRRENALGYIEQVVGRVLSMWSHAEPYVDGNRDATITFPAMNPVEFPDDWKLIVELVRVRHRFDAAVRALQGFNMIGFNRTREQAATEWRAEVRRTVGDLIRAVEGVPGFYLPFLIVPKLPIELLVGPLKEKLRAAS